MKNRLIKISILIFETVLLYVILNINIGCFFRNIFGICCPGCGLTRAGIALLKLDFYQAFRYNVLLFILFFPALFLFIEYLYSTQKNKKPLYKKIPEKVWVILIIILIIYAILRNVIPCLAPLN